MSWRGNHRSGKIATMVTLEVINEVSSEWEITSEVRRLVVTKAVK